MTYHEYLDSDDWKMLRQIVIDSQEGQCAQCGRDITQVHHITYPKTWAEDSPDNLIGLCGLCHMKESNIDKQSKTVKFASVWDYVMVERAKGRITKPKNTEQCKYEEKSICDKKNFQCEFYHGLTHIEETDYVICSCHNDTEDEEEY